MSTHSKLPLHANPSNKIISFKPYNITNVLFIQQFRSRFPINLQCAQDVLTKEKEKLITHN